MRQELIIGRKKRKEGIMKHRLTLEQITERLDQVRVQMMKENSKAVWQSLIREESKLMIKLGQLLQDC